MFRPFLVAIIRLYIPSFKSMFNMPTKLCSMMNLNNPYIQYTVSRYAVLQWIRTCFFLWRSCWLFLWRAGGLDPSCGVGRDRVSQVLPFSVEVRDSLLLFLVVGLCVGPVLCCNRRCVSRGWCIYGSLVVSFHSAREMYISCFMFTTHNGDVSPPCCDKLVLAAAFQLVRLHGTTRFPLDRFFMKFYFRDIYLKMSRKFGQKYRVLYKKTYKLFALPTATREVQQYDWNPLFQFHGKTLF
jgi:hypothetical protein